MVCAYILFRAKENICCFHDGEEQFANSKGAGDTSKAINSHQNMLYINQICIVSSDRGLK